MIEGYTHNGSVHDDSSHDVSNPSRLFRIRPSDVMAKDDLLFPKKPLLEHPLENHYSYATITLMLLNVAVERATTLPQIITPAGIIARVHPSANNCASNGVSYRMRCSYRF